MNCSLRPLDGAVLGCCMQHHRLQDFRRPVNATGAAVPAEPIGITHNHPKVRAWLARRPSWPSYLPYLPRAGVPG